MAKTKQRYHNKEGQIRPGVTTILGLLAKPALIHKAWELGMQGMDYRREWGKAADIGSITHYLIECYLKGIKSDTQDFRPSDLAVGNLAFSNFKTWWQSQRLKTVAVECSLVSEIMECGGTIDCVARHNGELWLIDFKTSTRVYDEMLYQLAAYWAIWNENYPNERVTSCHIVRLSKQDGRLTHDRFDRLYPELEVFRHLRIIYGILKDTDPKRNLDRVFKKLTLDRL